MWCTVIFCFLLCNFLVTAKDDNTIVDKLLEQLRSTEKDNIDPYPLPDRVIYFKQNFVIVTLSAEYKLHKCRVYGLSSLERDSSFSRRNFRDGFYLIGSLKFRELFANCSMKIRVQFLEQNSVLHGIGRNMKVNTELYLNKTSGRVVVEKFQLESADDLLFQFSSDGIIKSIANKFLWSISKLFHGITHSLVDIELGYILRIVASHMKYVNDSLVLF